MEKFELSSYKQMVLTKIISVLEIYCDKTTFSVVKDDSTERVVFSANNFYMYTSIKENDKEITIDDLDEIPLEFFISFETGTPPGTVSKITRLIMYVLRPDDLIILEDHFYSKKQSLIFYGDEAAEMKMEEQLKTMGKIRCPCCNTFVPNKIINSKTGLCKICEDIIIPRATFN